MEISIILSNKLKHRLYASVPEYFQQMASRMSMGHYRYGNPDKDKQYMKRMGLELKAYKKTGNREHLLNLSVYSWLESVAPQNLKFHWDSGVDSVTRGKV